MTRAASGTYRNVDSALEALAGLTSTARRTAFGTNSCRRPSRLAAISTLKILMPGGNATGLNRVFADAENDWNRRSSDLGGKRRRVAAGCGNHGNAAANEVSHERRQTIIFALQPVVFEPRVLAFDGAGLVEAFVERRDIARGDIATTAADKSDNWHSLLLRTRRERPSRRAAEQRD